MSTIAGVPLVSPVTVVPAANFDGHAQDHHKDALVDPAGCLGAGNSWTIALFSQGYIAHRRLHLRNYGWVQTVSQAGVV